MSAPSPVKVLAVGNYACSNIGDELLLATLKQSVECEGGELTAITLNPVHTKNLHGLDAVSYYDLPAIAARAREADVLVLGGGGIFTDRFMFTLPQLYAYPSFTLAQFASVCYLAKQFDLRLVLWGQGVGPLRTSDARQIVSDLFGIADYVSVRDAGSADLLRELGVEREVTVAPDPVWAMELPDPALDLRVKFPQLAGKKVLAVNPLVFERSDEMSTKLAAALKQSLDDDWACVWIAFQKTAINYDDYHFAMPSDRPLIERMVAEVGPGCTHVIWDDPNIQELLPALRQVDAAVMARFHGTILALRARIPIVVIEYDDKVTQAAEMAGVASAQRLRIEDAVEDYAAALRLVLGKDGGQLPWRAGTDILQDLATAAGKHRKPITDAIASARTRTRGRWKSDRYDWLFAWSTQIDARRWQAERELWKLTDALNQAKKQTEEEARQCARLRDELMGARKRIESMKSPGTETEVDGSANALTLFGKITALLRRLCAKLSKTPSENV
jgi:polysaccharide pyruvyl transferase CsaB